MPEKETLRFNFADEPTSAIDRTMRAIVMMMDGAIGELLKLGWSRDRDMITIVIDDDHPLPAYIEMRGERVFEVVAVKDGDRVKISGAWLKEPQGPGMFARWRKPWRRKRA